MTGEPAKGTTDRDLLAGVGLVRGEAAAKVAGS